MLGERLFTGVGGKGANQAVVAARLGATVTLLACVGQDPFGDLALTQLEREPLHLTVQRTATPTGLALIAVSQIGENSIIVVPGANGDLGSQHLTPELLVGQQLLVVQLEVPRATWQGALRAAREAGLRTVVNASPLDRDVTLEDFHDVDVLIVNEHEAATLLGVERTADLPTAQSAAHALALTGQAAVITLGARGAVWATRSDAGHVPGQPVQAVDTTGAGDAFCGALCAALTDGLPLSEAVAWGNAAGALTATRAGTVAALPSRSEVLAVLSNIGTH